MVAIVLLLTLLLTVAALLAPWALQALRGGPAAAALTPRDLPWQVQIHPDGHSEVLGLHLRASSDAPQAAPSTTLGQAGERWPHEVLELAVLRTPQGRLSLEAFLTSVDLGPLQGKLVLTAQVSDATLQDWASRTVRDEPLASGSHRLNLNSQDAAQARAQRIDGVVFLPSARLEEDVLVQRLGPPGLRLVEKPNAEGQTESSTVHLLYPERGLAIALDGSGRSRVVMQYVAPEDFEPRLRTPLLATTTAVPAKAQP